MVKKLFSLSVGELRVQEIMSIIFRIGLIPIVIGSFILIFFGNTFIPKMALFYFQSGIMPGRGLLYSVFLAVLVIPLIIAVWKIICELIFLVFRALEVYIRKNENI